MAGHYDQAVIAGIDLGTTNSLIGAMDAGFPILFADADGSRLTPSAVHFPASGDPVVGAAARRMRGLAPEETVLSVKRLIGSRESEIDGSDFPCRVVRDGAGRTRIRIRDRDLSPEYVSACILGKLKAVAECAAGGPIARAVITAPAYFNDAQRAATRAAGELAGFVVERILSEPTAAALAYGLDKLDERSKIAVYDLGGGTFDISVLELADGVFQVLATHGDTRLGGDDIDRAIANWIADEAAIADTSDPHIQARLTEAAESAKILLSTADTAAIRIPFAGDARHIDIELTRERFERLARPIIERTRTHCLRSMADAGLAIADLDAVILVGGSTRIPLVRAFVAEIFAREPDTSQHPDEAVALGAVIQAGIIEGSVSRDRGITLLDVTPLSLGIETFGGLMNVIIPRNTTIPVKRGEMFTNVAANQSAMRVTVLQGERELAADNWKLGEFDLAFSPAPKGQARVGVQFEIDASGILNVLARDVATGRDHFVAIRSAVDVSDHAVGQMIGDSVEHAFEDMSERIFRETRLKADEMLPAVRIALERMQTEIPAGERVRIQELVREAGAAIAARDTQKLKRLLQSLDDATQTLATLLIDAAMRDTSE